MRLPRIAAAAAILALPLLSVPSAHADGYATCFTGGIEPGQGGYYSISGRSCDGGLGVDIVIKVRTGNAAGTHRCQKSFSWNGFLGADGCRPEPS